ncbi:MAG: hypothetical protein OXT72_02880 [Gammaproteobacteria bacterium]|nr:hypothetical protein [Gammaproteobacteria bacterium]MDE0248046.1 hypothetical protein [Gammaproteobacteria bacterium]
MRRVARADSGADREARFHREFQDERGVTWLAGVRECPGLDFKGRFYFVAAPRDGTSRPDAREVWLGDVRWNSEATARRTLRTMSGVELRRRLREARARVSGRP